MASVKRNFQSPKGKSIRIEPDPPSLGPKLMSSAIRSASVGLAVELDRARVAGNDREGGTVDSDRAARGWSCERTPPWRERPLRGDKGKRLPLPLMGIVPKAYPSYRDILDTQLGGESFNSEEKEKNDTDAPVEKADARVTVL
ncbi:hypothetical protein Bca4012_036864 [Brassica carinata]